MRKRTRKTIVRELDKVFSKYIRERDESRCKTCGSFENPQCGHLFSRASYSTRWDEQNAFCQCAGCNIIHEHDPYPFLNWHRKAFGDEKQEELHIKFKSSQKFKDWELEEMIETYKKKLQDLEL